MAIYRKPRTVREWIEDNQPVTWAGHGAVVVASAAGVTLAVPLLAAGPVAALALAGYYVVCEKLVDEPNHKADGTWRLRDWLGIGRARGPSRRLHRTVRSPPWPTPAAVATLAGVFHVEPQDALDRRGACYRATSRSPSATSILTNKLAGRRRT